MTFPDNTYVKVIKYLGKTINDQEEIKTALTTAEQTPEVEAEVTRIIEQLDSFQQNLLTEQSSPNSAMVRADVVEWEAGARTNGMSKALKSLKQDLANLLGLTIEQSATGLHGAITLTTRTIIP